MRTLCIGLFAHSLRKRPLPRPLWTQASVRFAAFAHRCKEACVPMFPARWQAAPFLPTSFDQSAAAPPESASLIGPWCCEMGLEGKGPYALTPNTVELISTLAALFPRGWPVQDPVLTSCGSCGITQTRNLIPTWHPWRKAGPINHPGDKVESDR